MTEEETRFFAHDEADHARKKISKNRRNLYALAFTVIAYFKNDLKISFVNAEGGSSGLGFHGIIFIDGIDDDLIRLALSVTFLIVFARFVWFTLHFFDALCTSKEHDKLDMRASIAFQEEELRRQGEDPNSPHEGLDDEGDKFLKSYNDKEKFTKLAKKKFRIYHFFSDVFFPHFFPFVLGVIASYFAVPHIVRQLFG